MIIYLTIGFLFYLLSVMRCELRFSIIIYIALMIIYTLFYPLLLLLLAIMRCREMMK